jgi:hypothetical protein
MNNTQTKAAKEQKYDRQLRQEAISCPFDFFSDKIRFSSFPFFEYQGCGEKKVKVNSSVQRFVFLVQE